MSLFYLMFCVFLITFQIKFTRKLQPRLFFSSNINLIISYWVSDRYKSENQLSFSTHLKQQNISTFISILYLQNLKGGGGGLSKSTISHQQVIKSTSITFVLYSRFYLLSYEWIGFQVLLEDVMKAFEGLSVKESRHLWM